jgi:hypothetical protein
MIVFLLLEPSCFGITVVDNISQGYFVFFSHPDSLNRLFDIFNTPIIT